jgi:dihydropteroate synthase
VTGGSSKGSCLSGAERGALQLRGSRFAWGTRTYVMGIVNVTPDSFSGDGAVVANDALERAVAQYESGSDILDLGGESTRPGHDAVDESVERGRVIPAIERTRARLPDVPISVDTYKPNVARAAHEAGADIVNSIWGLPDALLDVAAELEMPVVAMHNQTGTAYEGVVMDAVLRFLDECAQRAMRRGIARERIVLDPGIGFGKTPDQNLEVLRRLDRIVALGFPTMLGASRKSTIGKLTGRKPDERVHGTVTTTALAIAAGIDIVRVHDVAAARDGISVADAIVRDWRPDGWIE